MDLQCALDLDQPIAIHPFGHRAEILLPLEAVSGLDDGEIGKLFADLHIPIFATWPVRHFPKEKRWSDTGPLFGKVLDCYRSFKPCKIGHLEVKGVVKGNQIPKLHGVIHYDKGHLLDSSRIISMHAAILSSSYGLQADKRHRKLLGIHKIYAHPRPE